jgi:hypothetical protein
MLLIGLETWPETIWIATVSLAAILLFSAASMNYFVTRSRLWESAILFVACFTLFRPDWWLNQFSEPYVVLPAAEFLAAVEEAPEDGRLSFVVEGMDMMGDDVVKTVNVPLGEPAEPLRRLQAIGLGVAPHGDGLMITDIAFGSYAKRIGLDIGYEVTGVLRKADQPSSLIPIGLAIAATAGVAGLQFARTRRRTAVATR